MGEWETAKLIETELIDLGLNFRHGLAGTGILAGLGGVGEGGRVILRADMDAVPVRESSGAPYHSRDPAYSHACGHDGHLAIVLGAGMVLRELSPRWRGEVQLLFQPGEETASGARAMIETGVLCGLRADAIFCLHAWPGLPVGHVACREGAMMAACDSFDLEVFGRGGHGARPHLAVNPLNTLAPICQKFLTMNTEQRVVSPCRLQVGSSNNVIADRGTLAGTLRTLDEDVRQASMREMKEIAERVARSHGTTARLSFETGCPVVVGDPGLHRLLVETVGGLLGGSRVHRLESPSMGSEDFGFFLEHLPGLMFRLGMGEGCEELHNPGFDFNDDALANGVLLMSALALRVCGLLNSQGQS